MDIEQIRAYCLSKPHATEDFPFDETTLVFRVMNKIFASIGLDNVDWFCLKCDPEYAIELREHYTGITGAWHWNKKYWNQIAITHGDVPDALIRSLIDHSYNEVVKKLPRKLRDSWRRRNDGLIPPCRLHLSVWGVANGILRPTYGWI